LTSPDLFPELIENTPLKLLEDQQILIQSGDVAIDLVGLSCSHNPDADHTRLSSFFTLGIIFHFALPFPRHCTVDLHGRF